MDQASTNDPQALMLQALIWILQDDRRAQRFLSLTGFDPDGLRGNLAEPAVLRGVVEFLEQYEPDLLECARTLGVSPIALLAAKDQL